MGTMMFTSHKFAGDKGSLTKKDQRVLVRKEFPGFLENQKGHEAVDKIMKDWTSAETAEWASRAPLHLTARLPSLQGLFVEYKKQKRKKQAALSSSPP